jgi:hypothetical protein
MVVLEGDMAHQDLREEAAILVVAHILMANPVAVPALLLLETHLLLTAAQLAPEMVLFLNLEEL